MDASRDRGRRQFGKMIACGAAVSFALAIGPLTTGLALPAAVFIPIGLVEAAVARALYGPPDRALWRPVVRIFVALTTAIALVFLVRRLMY